MLLTSTIFYDAKEVIAITSKPLFEKINVFDIPAPIFECDTDFNIVAVNNFAKSHLSAIKAGDNLYNFSSANIDILKDALMNLQNGKAHFSSEFILMLKKTPIHFYPITHSSSELKGIICSLVAEETLKPQANTQVPYTIGSLFRAPTMSILGNLQSIAIKLEEHEEYDELDRLNDIAKNCYYMMKSSKNLITYYRLVNNEILFDYNVISINTPFKNIITTIQAMLLDTNYELEVDISNTPLIVKCDFEYITYAIFQVILNSCMFSPSDSKIKISLSQNNNSVCIVISDEGVGIKGELIERVFEPFFSNKSGIPSSNGCDLGLGLPITKRIIESHGGSVYITSEVNKGTSIALRLPIVQDIGEVGFHSSSTQYVTRNVSDIYVYFSEILKLKCY